MPADDMEKAKAEAQIHPLDYDRVEGFELGWAARSTRVAELENQISELEQHGPHDES